MEAAVWQWRWKWKWKVMKRVVVIGWVVVIWRVAVKKMQEPDLGQVDLPLLLQPRVALVAFVSTLVRDLDWHRVGVVAPPRLLGLFSLRVQRWVQAVLLSHAEQRVCGKEKGCCWVSVHTIERG